MHIQFAHHALTEDSGVVLVPSWYVSFSTEAFQVAVSGLYKGLVCLSAEEASGTAHSTIY